MAQEEIKQNEKIELSQKYEIFLRHFEDSDEEMICNIHSDQEVMKFLGAKSKKQCKYYWQKGMTESMSKEFKNIGDKAIFAIILKDLSGDNDALFIGTAEISYDDDTNNSRVATIEYILDKKMWGKGLGTKVCLKMMDHGFNILKLDIIRAMIVQTNVASYKLCEKNGFIKMGKVEYNLNGKERRLFTYEITRKQYEQFLNR